MSITKRHLLTLCAATALGTPLAGCGATPIVVRHEVATGIARRADMTERVIPTDPFNITVWQRLRKPGAPANVYIEGDGLAWLGPRNKSRNPTPTFPFALQLAITDNADNVIYMARPCQYTGWSRTAFCPDTYWSNGRTAPEVIRSASQVLDAFKAFYPITSFNLIGYSGGAAVAVLVAAERKDILSLRTVAGNTDYAVMAKIHDTSPLNTSRAPEEVAATVAHIPQQHFIGTEDKIIPYAVFDGWEKASGPSTCIRAVLVYDATHEKGWAGKWPELLKAPLDCKVAPPPLPAPMKAEEVKPVAAPVAATPPPQPVVVTPEAAKPEKPLPEGMIPEKLTPEPEKKK